MYRPFSPSMISGIFKKGMKILESNELEEILKENLNQWKLKLLNYKLLGENDEKEMEGAVWESKATIEHVETKYKFECHIWMDNQATTLGYTLPEKGSKYVKAIKQGCSQSIGVWMKFNQKSVLDYEILKLFKM